MKKLSLLLACALLCGTASLAAAACSPEEAQKKANEFATAIQKRHRPIPRATPRSCRNCSPS